MLLDLQTLIVKHGLRIKGVVQIGAHYGEEYDSYKRSGIEHVCFFEPANENLKVLVDRFRYHKDVEMFYVGCSDKREKIQMHVETRNNGQSNSILKPANHTQQYPDITFDEVEWIQVVRLDGVPLLWHKYNFLNIDVQCAEMLVLKGATGILQHIDYIMSEVNYPGANLYEGCTDINEMDAFLDEHGFKRVEEPQWIGGTWSDSFWIRKTLSA